MSRLYPPPPPRRRCRPQPSRFPAARALELRRAPHSRRSAFTTAAGAGPSATTRQPQLLSLLPPRGEAWEGRGKSENEGPPPPRQTPEERRRALPLRLPLMASPSSYVTLRVTWSPRSRAAPGTRPRRTCLDVGGASGASSRGGVGSEWSSSAQSPADPGRLRVSVALQLVEACAIKKWVIWGKPSSGGTWKGRTLRACPGSVHQANDLSLRGVAVRQICLGALRSLDVFCKIANPNSWTSFSSPDRQASSSSFSSQLEPERLAWPRIHLLFVPPSLPLPSSEVFHDAGLQTFLSSTSRKSLDRIQSLSTL